MAHPSAKSILEATYKAWHDTKAGSIDIWLDIACEDVDFRSLAGGEPTVEFTRHRSGKSDLAGYLQGLVDEWEMEHYTVHHMICEGDKVAVVCVTAWSHKGTGKRVETEKVDVIEFRDGKMIAFFEYYDTAALIAAATPEKGQLAG